MQQVWLCIWWPKQFEGTFEKTQWRKFKQMQPMRLCLQMYYNHLRQTIYGDIHILGQILLNWFGEVTKNYWENYTIFRANVAKRLLDWLRIKNDNSTAYLVLWFLSFRRTAISCCNCLDILADSVVRCQWSQWNAKNTCIQILMIPAISN